MTNQPKEKPEETVAPKTYALVQARHDFLSTYFCGRTVDQSLIQEVSIGYMGGAANLLTLLKKSREIQDKVARDAFVDGIIADMESYPARFYM